MRQVRSWPPGRKLFDRRNTLSLEPSVRKPPELQGKVLCIPLNREGRGLNLRPVPVGFQRGLSQPDNLRVGSSPSFWDSAESAGGTHPAVPQKTRAAVSGKPQSAPEFSDSRSQRSSLKNVSESDFATTAPSLWRRVPNER